MANNDDLIHCGTLKKNISISEENSEDLIESNGRLFIAVDLINKAFDETPAFNPKNTDGIILKSEVIQIIESDIRRITMNATYGMKKYAVPSLYLLSDKIKSMPVHEANWIRDDDGAWKCSHCGYRFFNGANIWHKHCNECGYFMKG